MKILTILIFSGDRFCVKDLLSDIVKLSKKNIDIRVAEWSDDKRTLKKKKYIYSHFAKKIKNFKVYYEKGVWEFKYLKFINGKFMFYLVPNVRSFADHSFSSTAMY